MITAQVRNAIKGKNSVDDPYYLILKDDDLPAYIIRFDTYSEAISAQIELEMSDDVEGMPDANFE